MRWFDPYFKPSTDRERMPYLQIDTDTWVVIRESLERPQAVIQRVIARDGTEKYLLFTWRADPTQRRLHGTYDTIEAANLTVKWNNPQPAHPGLPEPLRQPNPNEERVRNGGAQTAGSRDSRTSTTPT